MSTPLLLLWGKLDPWIRPAAADRIQELYPPTIRIDLNAGHCPHVRMCTCIYLYFY